MTIRYSYDYLEFLVGFIKQVTIFIDLLYCYN